jgi:hypothetical protein
VNTQSSQAPEQNDWQEFKPLFGGGKIKICDTLRAVTPFGGLSVFIEFLGRIGLVEQLANRAPYQPRSANDPGQILVGFHLERHCWSSAFCPYQSVTGSSSFTRATWY